MSTAVLPQRDTRIWFYVTLYPSRLDLLDGVVGEIVPDLVAGTADWFFLRYLDTAGPHIRLRRLLDRDAADEACTALHGPLERLREMAGRVPRSGWSVLSLDAPASGYRGRCAVEVDLYEPETAKWGEGRALAAAHDLFGVSSRAAVICTAKLDGSVESRIALGTAVILAVLRRLGVNGAQAQAFLSQHYDWWSGSAHDTAGHRDRALRASLAELDAERVTALVAIHLDADDTAAFTEALAVAAHSHTGPHKPMFLVFHQLHLMLNRLGVVPSEEAVCSLLALRLCS